MEYKSLIRSHLDYGSPVYGSASDAILRRLDVFQNVCLRMCLGALQCTRVGRLEVEANIPPLRLWRDGLLLAYGLSTVRKIPLGFMAANIIKLHHHLHVGRHRPLAIFLYTICQRCIVDLNGPAYAGNKSTLEAQSHRHLQMATQIQACHDRSGDMSSLPGPRH